MKYKKITNSDITFFIKTLSEDNVFCSESDLKKYSHDETEDLSYLPEIVLKPCSTKEISECLEYCNKQNIPVTACGARTGLSGGSIPLHGGVALSVENLNKIISIDKENLQATVESGVINQNFKSEVEKSGLFYPPDPASLGSCMLGGNVAENSGGPKALKYGVTRDYVLNLEVVLADGSIIWTGANVLKNATGYSLTDLIVGSEGTLAVITKIVFKLIALPPKSATMLIPFKSAEDACKSVSIIFNSGIVPCALEFMERDALLLAVEYSQNTIIVEDDEKAHLLIEVDGDNMNSIFSVFENISKLLSQFNLGEIKIAETHKEKEKIWKLRRLVGEAVKKHSIYKEEDTVVPRFQLPKLLLGVKEIGKKYNFRSICYGHAGDGNLHVNILKENNSDEFWNNNVKLAIREIFKLTKYLGGTISGEHGIGLVQKEYLDIVFGKKMISLHKEIKKVFDPNGILNPGKIFD